MTGQPEPARRARRTGAGYAGSRAGQTGGGGADQRSPADVDLAARKSSGDSRSLAAGRAGRAGHRRRAVWRIEPGRQTAVTLPRSVGQLPVFYNHKPSGGARTSAAIMSTCPQTALRLRARAVVHPVLRTPTSPSTQNCGKAGSYRSLARCAT
jgi:hypothetical protein